MHEVYKEQEIPSKLSYPKFLKFVKLDDTIILKGVFESIAGKNSSQVDVRLVLLYMMNCTPLSKEEKLKFAFNIFDEEESRIITYKELLKILQANYFAGSPQEVERKAKLILDEVKGNSEDNAITYEDFMNLSKKFSALFFPAGF